MREEWRHLPKHDFQLYAFRTIGVSPYSIMQEQFLGCSACACCHHERWWSHNTAYSRFLCMLSSASCAAQSITLTPQYEPSQTSIKIQANSELSTTHSAVAVAVHTRAHTCQTRQYNHGRCKHTSFFLPRSQMDWGMQGFLDNA